jgi:hypothetical protein
MLLKMTTGMQQSLKLLSIAVLAAGTLVGCSKREETSNVSFQFPDWNQVHQIDVARRSKVSTLSESTDSAKIDLIVVNITAKDLPTPAIWIWESPHDSRTVVTPPTAATLTVSKGAGRLIQALALYKSGAMEFFYADQLKDLNSDSESVDLTLTNFVTSKNLIEGNISGRFLTGSNTGYTGPFHYRFNPPGKPSMIVHTGEMFSGWVSGLFALSEGYLSYTKPDGTALFPGMTNSSLEFFKGSQSQNAARVYLPASFENQSHSWSNGQPSYYMVPVNSKRAIVGFFGDAAYVSGKKLCLPTSPSSLSPLSSLTSVENLYKTADAAHPTAAPSNPIKWAGKTDTAGNATDFAYVEAPSASIAKGGDDSASCVSSGQLYVDRLYANGAHADYGDGFLGFRGPFRPVDTTASNNSSDSLGKVSFASNTITVEWAFLPGVEEDIGLAKVFYRQLSATDMVSGAKDNEIRQSEGFRCGDFEKEGFSPAFSSVEATVASPKSVTISGVADQSAASRYQIVICPRSKDKSKFYASGTQARFYSGGMGGGNQMKFEEVLPHAGTNAAPTDTCVKMKLKVVDYNNSPLQAPAGGLSTQVAANSSLGEVRFYATNDCSSTYYPNNLPLIVSEGSSEISFSMMTPASAGSISLSSNGVLGYNSAWMNFAVYQVAGSVPYPVDTLNISGAQTLAPNRCYAYTVSTWHASVPTVSSTDSTLDLSISGLSGSFYANSSCMGTPVTSAILPAYSSSVEVFFSPSAPAPSGYIMALIHGTSFSASTPVIHVGDSNLANWLIGSFGAFHSAQCEMFYVFPANADGAMLTATSDHTVSVTVTNAKLYTDLSTCSADSSGNSGTANVSLPIYQGQDQSMFYYVKPVLGASTITFNASESGGVSSPSQSFAVSAGGGGGSITSVAVALPGQTFTGGVVSGMPAEQAMGVPFNITIYAMTSGNVVDTSFNGTLSSLMSSGSMFNQITNPVTFVNGVAMAAVQYNWPNTSAVITASIGGVNGIASSLFVAPDQVPKELRLFSSAAT